MIYPSDLADWMRPSAQSAPRPSPMPLIRALTRARAVVLAAESFDVFKDAGEVTPTSPADVFATAQRLLSIAESYPAHRPCPERDAILKAASEVPS